jgi:CheY-like chemotaxis protein
MGHAGDFGVALWNDPPAPHSALDRVLRPKYDHWRILPPARSIPVTDLPQPGSGDPATTGSTTVLIADDNPDVLESVKEIIATDNSLTVVAAATEVGEAIRLGRINQPQVAVLDVNMPDGGGWEAARGLLEACPGIRLVAYSSFDHALITRTMTQAGVSAFVSKGSDIELLLRAIHGENVMPAPARQTMFRKDT